MAGYMFLGRTSRGNKEGRVHYTKEQLVVWRFAMEWLRDSGQAYEL